MFSRCGLSLHVPVTRLLASRGASPSADLCKSKSPTAEAPPRPVRRAEFYAGRARWVWMQVLQYRRGDRCSFEPGRCSRSLLGQSVTRQVGAAGRSIAPSSQVLPVIPMPGGERSWRKGRQPYFCSNCSFLATAAWAGSAASNKRVSPDILQTGMASCCSSLE